MVSIDCSGIVSTTEGKRIALFFTGRKHAKLPGNTDLLFVVVAPSAAAWGTFWDTYKNSPAERADMANRDVVICTDSALMESVEVK